MKGWFCVYDFVSGVGPKSRLERKIAVGVAQAERGEVTEFDPDEVRQEVERRYAEQPGKRAG